MFRCYHAFLLFAALGLATPAAIAADLTDPVPAPRPTWIHFDAPLWDLTDEGLPFRFTLALPAKRDLLTRVLFAHETRWTGSIGYARVYNSYDPATDVLKNRGGHAAMISAGRQFRWRLSPLIGRWAPDVAIEFGVNLASRPFPADGTRANLKLISGLEWVRRKPDARSGWSAGVFWPHFSNANLLSRNAGYDGLVIRLGRIVPF